MKKYMPLSVLIVIAFYVTSCKMSAGVEKFGAVPKENSQKTAIGSILLNPKNYLNKEVIIEGAITSECPAGGWINVHDDSGGTIYVDMHGSSFAPIPQRVGRKVIVEGTVFQSKSNTESVQLIGKGLIIK